MPTVLRNKAAQILTLLFSNIYPNVWPTFFDDLIALTETPTKSPSNPTATEFFLRVSLSVDEEIARQDIQRSRDQVNRNTLLKDAMRERDIPKLAAKWFEVLQEYRTRDPSIAELALRVIGSYVAWMDISLVVNDQVMTALYQMLADEQLRIAACECLAEVRNLRRKEFDHHFQTCSLYLLCFKVVSKGMKPLDKLSLIQMLNITDTLKQLDLVSLFVKWPIPHAINLHNVSFPFGTVRFRFWRTCCEADQRFRLRTVPYLC